jgi:hypothetical protein
LIRRRNDLWISLAQRRRLRGALLRHFDDLILMGSILSFDNFQFKMVSYNLCFLGNSKNFNLPQFAFIVAHDAISKFTQNTPQVGILLIGRSPM